MFTVFFSVLDKIYKYKKYKTQPKDEQDTLKEYFSNADCMIDVSGLALSSQMGFKKSLLYLLGITAAKNYNIPVFIFPQSMGPFNYNKAYQRLIIKAFMKQAIAYPQAIYVRENEGLEYIKQFNKKAKLSHDLVLQYKHEIDENMIFKQGMMTRNRFPDIPENSVAIIPNEKTLVHGNKQETIFLLRDIISELLRNDLNVFLLSHSAEDMAICNEIKIFFAENEKVS